MKRVSFVYIIVIIIGTGSGIRYPFSYQYRYSATVATGVPGVGDQYAIAAIETTVVVDTILTNNRRGNHAIVKFKDTRVGQQHGSTHCGALGDLPTRDRLSVTDRALLHKPFQINYSDGGRPVLEVPRGDPLWMTNLRKAVVNLIRVIPTTEHLMTRSLTNTLTNSIDTLDETTPLVPRHFKLREDTLQGSCMVHYTLTPAPPSERAHLPVLQRDIQKTAGVYRGYSWPKVSDYLFLLLRSPDFNDCTQQPVIFHSTNSEENINNTQKQYEQFLTQSSLGRFLIRGEDNPEHRGNLRLERVQVTGGAEMKPLGVTGTSLHVITNQTLELESSTYHNVGRLPGMALVPARTMMFEMESPFARSSRLPVWIRYGNKRDPLYPIYPESYLTGYSQNATIIERLKTKLLHANAEAATILQTSMTSPASASSKSHRLVPSGATVVPEVAEHMASISDIIRALPKPALQDLENKLKSNGEIPRQIYFEAMAASGSPAALDILLSDILATRQAQPLRAYATLSTLTNAFYAPISVVKLFNFAKELSRGGSQPASTPGDDDEDNRRTFDRALLDVAVLGTSTALQKVCTASNEQYYTDDYEAACSLEEEFLRFIKQQIQASTSSSEKATLLYAVGYLSSPEAFQFVSETAVSVNTSALLRTAAVFSMMPQHTPAVLRERVLDSLQPVLESQVEPPEVRQVAIMTLLSWQPSQAWWLRLAKASWSEESKAVAEFVYTATKAIAQLKSFAWRQQSEYARQALGQMKPVLAPSQQSFLKIIESFAQTPVMESETKLGWILNVKTMLPEELFLTLTSKMNGVKMPLLETLFLGDDLMSFWQKLQLTETQPRGSVRGHSQGARLRREFGDILHGLGSPSPGRPAAESLLLLRVFADVHHALPLRLDWLQRALAPVRQPHYQHEKEVNFVKYLNPVRREVILPSDIGLPIIGRIQTPVLLYQKGKYKIATSMSSSPNTSTSHNNTGEHSYSVDVSYEGNTTFSSTMETTMTVLVPWQNISLEVGVQVKAGLAAHNTAVGLKIKKDGLAKDAELYMRLGFDKRVPVAVFSKVPFTVSRDLGPGPNHPGTRALHKLKMVQPPHSTSHKHSYHIPSTSTGITGHITTDEDGEPQLPELTNPWTYLYGGAPTTALLPLRRREVTLYLDSSANNTQHASVGLRYVAATSGLRRQHSDFVKVDIGDSRATRLQRLDQFTESGGYMLSATANFSSTAGRAPRRYEVCLLSSATARPDTSHQHRRYQVTFARAGVPGDVPHPKPICLHTEVNTPSLPATARLDRLLQSPLTADLNATLLAGGDCDEKDEVANIKAHLSISQPELQYLSRNLPGQCNFDRLDPTTSLRRAAFYDDVLLELTWKQDIPDPILSGAYHAANAVRVAAFPYTVSDCVHVTGPERRIVVNVTRSLESKKATGWVSRPGCREDVKDLPVPEVLDMLLPLHGKYTLKGSDSRGSMRRHSSSAVIPPGNQCYVLPQRVVTFDGVSYEVLPSPCSRVIIKHVDGDDSFMVLTHRADLSSGAHQVFRVVVPASTLDIELSGTQVSINGEILTSNEKDILDNSRKLIARIIKSEATVEVNFPSRLHLLVKEGTMLVLRLEGRYASSVGGLCGDFDGESHEDLRDPRGCVYSASNGVVYATSWTTQPCSVDEHVMLELKKQQWYCPRSFADLAQPATDDYDPDACTRQVHRVVEHRGSVCLTTVPVRTCRDFCIPLTGTEIEAMFELKCWTTPQLPTAVQEAQVTGYLHYLAPGGSLEHATVSLPMECIPRRS